MLATTALCGALTVATTTLSSPSGAAAPHYVWPKAGQNGKNADMSLDPSINTTSATKLGVRWMTNTGQEVLSSPIVDFVPKIGKTLIFAGNEAGNFTAYDEASGLPVWSAQMSGPIRDSAVTDGHSVWVGDTKSGRVVKLNASTGAIQCSAPVGNTTGESIDASLLLAKPTGGVPTVYVGLNDVGSFNGPLTAVNASTCAVEWQSTPEPKPGSGGIWDFLNYSVNANGTPVVLFGTADPDSGVYEVNATTGATVWRFQPANPPPGTYDIGAGVTTTAPGANGFADGMAYVPSKYGILYALDLTTGAMAWQFNFGAVTGQSPAGSLATPAISGTNVVIDVDGGTFDVNAVTGAQIWYHNTGSTGADGAPAIVGPAGSQVIANITTTGLFQVLSLATGSLLYSYQTGSFAVGSVVDTNGNLIDTGGDGFIYDFAPGGGNGGTPTTAVTSPTNGVSVSYPSGGSLTFSGTSSDTAGVAGVNVAVQMNGSTGLWWNGAKSAWQVEPYPNPATLATAGANSSTWTYSLPVPISGGNFNAFVSAVGTNGVADVSSGESTPNPARSEVTVMPKSGLPTMTLGKGWVPPGGQIHVSGSGFSANETVGFSIEGLALNTLTADSSGSISGLLTMKASMSYGTQQLTAMGQTSGLTTTAPVYISSQWAQFGDNPQLNAFDPDDSVLSTHLSVSQSTFLTQAWSFATGAAIDGSVVVQDQAAYVADSAGHVDAISIPTGGQLWSTSTPDGSSVVNTPALTQTGYLAVTTTSGDVFEVNQSSGALRWSVAPGGDFVSSPTVAGTTMYVVNNAGTVTALNVNTGSTLWSKALGSAVTGGLAVDPAAGMVFVGDAAGNVLALNATTGAADWTTTEPGSFTAAPMELNKVVYAASTNGTLYAMAEATGTANWTFNAGSPVTAPLSSQAGVILVGTTGGHIYYVDAAGSQTYQAQFDPVAVTGIAGADNFVTTQESDGTAWGSKPADADPKAWAAATGTTFTSAPTLVNGEVFVTGQDGVVRVYTVPGSPPV